MKKIALSIMVTFFAFAATSVSAEIVLQRPVEKTQEKIVFIACEKNSQLPHCVTQEKQKLFIGDPAKCSLDSVCKEMFKNWIPNSKK